MEYARAIHIAKVLIEDMLEEDKESCLITLRTSCDFTKNDCEFFGIDYEELKSAGVKESV